MYVSEKFKGNLVDQRKRDGVPYQATYRFDNGFGASVIRGPRTYGGPEGLFELGVIEWHGNVWDLTYDTPITDDVLGWLTEDDVDNALLEISRLDNND